MGVGLKCIKSVNSESSVQKAIAIYNMHADRDGYKTRWGEGGGCREP